MHRFIALCAAFLLFGMHYATDAARLLQGTKTTADTRCTHAPPPTTEPPVNNATYPIIFMRPAYYRANANELPWVYSDRHTGATMAISAYTPQNAQTTNLPFKPLGSLVRGALLPNTRSFIHRRTVGEQLQLPGRQPQVADCLVGSARHPRGPGAASGVSANLERQGLSWQQ